mgnify:CR=1 FL=1|jgi:hypothetical protein
MKPKYDNLTILEVSHNPEEGWEREILVVGICDLCGSVVTNRALHNNWHELIRLNRVL